MNPLAFFPQPFHFLLFFLLLQTSANYWGLTGSTPHWKNTLKNIVQQSLTNPTFTLSINTTLLERNSDGKLLHFSIYHNCYNFSFSMWPCKQWPCLKEWMDEWPPWGISTSFINVWWLNRCYWSNGWVQLSSALTSHLFG